MLPFCQETLQVHSKLWCVSLRDAPTVSIRQLCRAKIQCWPDVLLVVPSVTVFLPCCALRQVAVFKSGPMWPQTLLLIYLLPVAFNFTEIVPADFVADGCVTKCRRGPCSGHVPFCSCCMALLSPAAREAAPAAPSGKAPTGTPNAQSPGGAMSGHIVSPDELREALSELDKGQSAVEFELSEMHDAAEVGWILSS